MANDEKPALQIPEAAGGWASTFPYAMILFSFSLTGVAFCAIDIPLVWVSATSDHALSLKAVLWCAKTHLVVALQGMGGGAGFLWLSGLLAMAVGVFLQPFQQAPLIVLNWLVSLTRRLFRVVMRRRRAADETNPRPFFYRPAFTDPACNYAMFAEWLQYHKNEKLTWEWELFNYYLGNL
jgi:hypothetical protein